MAELIQMTKKYNRYPRCLERGTGAATVNTGWPALTNWLGEAPKHGRCVRPSGKRAIDARHVGQAGSQVSRNVPVPHDLTPERIEELLLGMQRWREKSEGRRIECQRHHLKILLSKGSDRGGGERDAILAHGATAEGYVTLAGNNDAGIGNRARRAAGHELRRNLAAAGGGKLIGIGGDASAKNKTVAGGEEGLAFVGGDRAGVGHGGTEEEHGTAAFGGGGGCMSGNLRAGLDGDGPERIGEGGAGGARAIKAAVEELSVGHASGGGHEVADVDLRSAAENDAVAVEHIDGAVGLDRAKNLRGRRLRVGHAVEGDPVLVALLVKDHVGLASDIKTVPGEDGLLRFLVDLDDEASVLAGRLHRKGRTLPEGGIEVTPAATCRPPAPRPLGTVDCPCNARVRAAACTCCMAWSTCTERVSDWRCDWSCCARGRVRRRGTGGRGVRTAGRTAGGRRGPADKAAGLKREREHGGELQAQQQGNARAHGADHGMGTVGIGEKHGGGGPVD